MLDMLEMKYFQSKYFAMGNTLDVGLIEKMGNQLKNGPNFKSSNNKSKMRIFLIAFSLFQYNPSNGFWNRVFRI